jgi:hypothetical protein
MPTNTVPMGSVFPMVQNTIYALPPVKCTLFTDATTPTIQQSLTVAFTANVALTLTGGQADVNGGFIRLTSSGPVNVLLKRN